MTKFKKSIVGFFIFLMFFGSFYPNVSFAAEEGPVGKFLWSAAKFLSGYHAVTYLYRKGEELVEMVVDKSIKDQRWRSIKEKFVKGDRYLFFVLDEKYLVAVASEKDQAFIYENVIQDYNPDFPIIGILSENLANSYKKIQGYTITGVAGCTLVYTDSLESQEQIKKSGGMKKRRKVYAGEDCYFGEFFKWSQDLGNETETKFIMKASEKKLTIDLEVDQGLGKWYSKFEIVERGGNVEDKFKKLIQAPVRWTSEREPAGGEDWAGKAILEINVEGLAPGYYNVPIRAVQDFNEKIGINYKTEMIRSVYFAVPKEGAQLKTDTPTGTIFVFPETKNLNNLQVDNIPALIGNSIKTAMGLLGSIAFVMFVYGGVLWMTSMGNSEKSKKSTQIIIWTSLGMIVILASWTIMEFVFSAF